ncbi:MAG: S41 family peptidase [Patescibacteria group bacterium]
MQPENTNSFLSVRTVAGWAVVLVTFSFSVGAVVGAYKNAQVASVASAIGLAQFSPPPGVDFSPVWKAWTVIDERFVPARISTSTATSTEATGATDPQERVWGMIEGLASSLGDPYTLFLPPTDAKIFEEDISGNFEGVGMEIAIRENILTVVSPLKDSPAAKAGLKAADKILKIDDADTRSMSVEAAVKRIRGTKGTTVTFKVLREGEADFLTIPVVRDVINIPTIKTELRKDGVFLIQLYNFSALSAGLFRDALREFKDSGSHRLILDLRGNPGGYLEASVDMASWFLPLGSVVVTEDYGDRGEDIVHRSRGYNIFDDSLDMVILVDRGSASASEILSGALQHYKIAQLVGTNTFGKGSVQELVPITTGTSLKITVARWLMPSGFQIPNDGIPPDTEVKIEKKDVEAGKDPQLDKAVELLLKGE